MLRLDLISKNSPIVLKPRNVAMKYSNLELPRALVTAFFGLLEAFFGLDESNASRRHCSIRQ